MKRIYGFKIDILDAIDAFCWRIIDRVTESRKKAHKRWTELGGAG